MNDFLTPGGWHECVKGFCFLLGSWLVYYVFARLGIDSLLDLQHFCVRESDLCFWHFSREFDSRVKVVCLFHNLSSLFCLDLCSIGKTNRQYLSKTAVPRDFLYAVSGSVKSLWGPKRKAFFLAKHPAAREKNPLATRVRTNTTLSQHLVSIGAFGTVSKDTEKWLEEIGVTRRLESLQRACLLGTARILRKVLDTLRPVTGDDLMFKENSSNLSRSCV